MDNDSTHIVKATQDFFKAAKLEYSATAKSMPNLNPTEHIFHILKAKTPKQAESEESCSKDLAEHPQGRNSASRDLQPSIKTGYLK